MKSMFLKDFLSKIQNMEMTPEGFLHVPARVGKPGILEYVKGDGMLDHIPEFRNLPIGTIIPILRDESATFDENSLRTYKFKPVTNNHPDIGLINAKTAKQYQIGFTKGEVEKNNNAIKVGLVITDAEAIADIQKGKKEISAGYECELDIIDGIHPEYGSYKGIQRDIRCNHIAIVASGRAGHEIRIGDKKTHIEKETKKMGDVEIMNLHSRKINGVTVSFSDQAAEAFDQVAEKVENLKKKISKLEAQITDEKSKSEKLQGQLDAEKAKALDNEAIDKLVKERTAIIDSAKRLNSEIETEGKSNVEIMRESIKGISLDGKSDDYVKGVFETQISKFEDDSRKAALEDSDDSVVSLEKEARKKFIAEGSGR